ncbi:thiamine pyrophosphate-dependent enzyme [Saccharopolyspora sp. ASAGF58]|uniref:thiamine pyrophosphate-dependent enzyme n=1 Tax=Saccharopolyspora sp. ASAGF58 TaxID=2719023 RepID=UPI00143FFBB0|nr:thiamine pyrophosphate-dependent enzyme [Saccharopolyspora sp. ASAGF58]QIZ37586.1 phosphonopyruvate decarboxylase [Saccharopolyspora sp. ASAGF58]
MKRIEALRVITDRTPDLAVTATCAATSRELAAVADRDNHLYLLDAMGLTVSVGTGVALGIAGTKVSRSVVIDGDGSLLMNLGAAATAGYLAPDNLVILLLDNGVYASTAGIPTQAEKLDLGAIAESVRLQVLRAADTTELGNALQRALAEPGPWFVHVRIEPGNEPGTPLLLIDPVVHADRFRRWLTNRIAA